MKQLLRKSILVLGVIIATLVLINNFGYADTVIENEKNTLTMQTELLVANIVTSMDQEDIEESAFKVFNDNDQLVYETRNIKDEKLLQLIKTSDFLTEVNKISYYKLSR
jgi:hypothetical protein